MDWKANKHVIIPEGTKYIQHAIVAIRAANGIAVVERIVGREIFRQEAVVSIRMNMLVVVIMLVGQIDICFQVIILTNMIAPHP